MEVIFIKDLKNQAKKGDIKPKIAIDKERLRV